MVRRWMRTMPLYFLWLVVLGLVAFPPEGTHVFLRYFAFLQNLAWELPPSRWFAVSWSLAVEEWFYFLFSIVFLSATALFGPRRAGLAAIALFVAVPVVLREGVPGIEDYGEGMLHVVVMRLDAIAYGVAFAWLWVRRSALFRHPWIAGMAGVGLLWLFWGPKLAILLRLPAVTFLNAAMVGNGIGVCLLLAGLLALPQPPRWLVVPVRTLSNLSYAIYLIHLSVFDLILRWGSIQRIGRGGTLATIVLVTLGLAYASWRWFESPILARRPAQGRGRLPARGAVMAG